MTKGTIRLSLLVILTLALLPPLVARATGAQVVQVTSDADRDAETSIAINPTNPNNVLAGWISSGDRTCGFGVSFDGGLHSPVIVVVQGRQLASVDCLSRVAAPS